MLRKESEIIKFEREKRDAAFDALVETRRNERIKKERETKMFLDKQKEHNSKLAQDETTMKQMDYMAVLNDQKKFE